MEYKVTKRITAKNLKEAIKLEPNAESIELIEPEQLQDALGFRIDPDWHGNDSYDPEPSTEPFKYKHVKTKKTRRLDR